MMHYMPWYKTPAVRGAWGTHWTGPKAQHHPDRIDGNGLPDIWSHYHPMIGPYDSSDRDLLECHLLQMKLAGVNGVIVDWYGIGNTDDYPQIHDATKAMFKAAGRFGMKFAACFEDRSIELAQTRGKLQPAQIPAELSRTIQWMDTEWFSKPQHLRLRNRPVLLNFGPVYVHDAAVWSTALEAAKVRPLFYGLHHLWKKAGADGGFTWVHYDPWEGVPTPETTQRRLREVFNYSSSDPQKLIASAYPGFNDVYDQHHPLLDHRHGEVVKASLQVAIEGPWPIVQLVTWNDYGEGTMIEPTHEFGYTFLEIVQEARRKEMGAAFPFTPDDLRLPARLYAMRKNKSVPAATLDNISRLLNSGACQKSRVALDQCERALKVGGH